MPPVGINVNFSVEMLVRSILNLVIISCKPYIDVMGRCKYLAAVADQASFLRRDSYEECNASARLEASRETHAFGIRYQS